MIRSYKDQSTDDLHHGRNTKAARRVSRDVWNVAIRKLNVLANATTLEDVQRVPGNEFEKIKTKPGIYSIRINRKYRITFKWEGGGAVNVWVGDYHDDL